MRFFLIYFSSSPYDFVTLKTSYVRKFQTPVASDDKDEKIKNAKMSSSLQSNNHLIAVLCILRVHFYVPRCPWDASSHLQFLSETLVETKRECPVSE